MKELGPLCYFGIQVARSTKDFVHSAEVYNGSIKETGMLCYKAISNSIEMNCKSKNEYRKLIGKENIRGW